MIHLFYFSHNKLLLLATKGTLVRLSILDWHFTDGSSHLRKHLNPRIQLAKLTVLWCERCTPSMGGNTQGSCLPQPAEAANRKDFLQKASPGPRVSCGLKSDLIAPRWKIPLETGPVHMYTKPCVELQSVQLRLALTPC